MTETEMGQLLLRIQNLDHRALDVMTRENWQTIIGDLRYDDAVRAVAEHYRMSGEYLMPHHIYTLATRYRQERDEQMRREMEGGLGVPEGCPEPPYYEAMVDAARAATKASIEAGHGRGSDATKQAAHAASAAVAETWQAEHGQWDVVWRTYEATG